MKYSVLTASNSNNKIFYKNFLKSLNAQSPLASELVFINDGIKLKNIKSLIRQKLKKKIKLIYLDNLFNKGISKSLNIGFKKCNHKLIFRLDIDDSWYPNHVKKMLNEFKLNKKFLIYANSSKYFNKGIVDEHLIIDNPTIHSSWLINLFVIKKRKFKYSSLYPEDYATLSYYYRKGFKYKIINQRTINYNDRKGSFSKKKLANKDLNEIRIKNAVYYIKKNSYIKLVFDLGILGTLKLLKILFK